MALGQGPLNVEELASRIGASVNGTERLCAVLVQTQYLEYTSGNLLRNSPHAQAWLSQTGEKDLNSVLRWFAHSWQLMSGLRDAVLDGHPKTGLWDLMKTNPSMGPTFATYMKDHTASMVDAVQHAIQLPVGAKKLLDVGGSHGLHAVAFCRRSPELTAVIYDLEVSLTNTPCLIEECGLSDRISCVEANIVQDTIPGTFDIITYFLVAHNHTDEGNVRIIQKMADALNPGGVLFVYEYARDSEPNFKVSSSEALAAAFDLTLLVETGTHTHTAERIISWMQDAGLENIRRTNIQPLEEGAIFSGMRI